MPMSDLFFDSAHWEAQITLLLGRMLALQEAVGLAKISAEELGQLAAMPVEEIDSQRAALQAGIIADNSPFKKVFDILSKSETPPITDASACLAGLRRFDKEHGAYLPLAPLASVDRQTLALSLGDFAVFYDVFIKHLQVSKNTGELSDDYTLGFNAPAAGLDWQKWQRTRQEHMRFDSSKAAAPALFEKFLTGSLEQNAWLSDLDIQRQLRILGLENLVHVLPFSADNIALAMHFERANHQYDDPPIPYTIPFILNLGEDGHSKLGSRGKHWTRMMVHVDPRNIPYDIRVDYTDSLFLPENNKADILKTVRTALAFRVEQETQDKAAPVKIFTAFPECDKPTITIRGSGEQQDGFSCGYWAVQGMTRDLFDKIPIKASASAQALLACSDAVSLRDVVYRSLLGKQPVSLELKDRIEKQLAMGIFDEQFSVMGKEFVIKPVLVEGQLLSLSRPAAGKTSPKAKPFDATALEGIVRQHQQMQVIKTHTLLQELASKSSASQALDIAQIMAALTDEKNTPELILQAMLEQLAKNSHLRELQLSGAQALTPEQLQPFLDALPLHIRLTSTEVNLQDSLAVIDARNRLLTQHKITPPQGSDLWEALFEKVLFTPREKPTGSRLDLFNGIIQDNPDAWRAMGARGFAKLLQFVSEHEDKLQRGDFPYEECCISLADMAQEGNGLLYLSTLKNHVQAGDATVPLKRFYFSIPEDGADTAEQALQLLMAIIQAQKPPLFEQITINMPALATLSSSSLDALLTLILDKKHPTVIAFLPKETLSPGMQAKLRLLENAALLNRRTRIAALAPLTGDAKQVDAEAPPVALGKIGVSILGVESLQGLETEVQIQAQQQQQVQQQVQAALDNEDMPEEDELLDEAFMPFTPTEELVTRNTIATELGFFIGQRHPHLSPEAVWDLIVGEHADWFKYGIKKMTISAAKVLIDHLQDVQYGLHPDNLPKGFGLTQTQTGALVLGYSPFDAAINPNESPLTVQWSKPLASQDWAGDSLQWMTEEQAKALYETTIAKQKKPRPSLTACLEQFFFLKSDAYSNLKKMDILHGVIAAIAGKEKAHDLQKTIEQVFGNTLSDANIRALAEVIYAQGVEPLARLLDDFQRIQRVKGEAFFQSFKACFIDPSQNLNELSSASAHTAMQKLLTMTSAQTVWWLSLTGQHTSNRYYQGAVNDKLDALAQSAGRRWANLGELSEGFFYFCGQLEEISPGLSLTEYCPLQDVGDMRVALDRLLTTILPNAHDLDEQFYQGLPGLSLGPLGPFYASRYEGYKLVTSAMMLDFGRSYANDPRQNQYFAKKGYNFLCDKINIQTSLVDQNCNTEEKKTALLLRYIATLNHRAPQSQYLEAIRTLSVVEDTDDAPNRYNDLLALMIVFGSGKRGKHFTQTDISRLRDWILAIPVGSHADKMSGKLIEQWRTMAITPIRPTIAEIIDINQLAMAQQDPRAFVYDITSLAFHFQDTRENAEFFMETFTLFTKNQRNPGAHNFLNIVQQLEGLNSKSREKKPEYDFDTKTRLATARLMAVCQAMNAHFDSALEEAKDLFNAVRDCLAARKAQTTRDLLELLGHIDVERSPVLPSLRELIALIEHVTKGPDLDYNQLEKIVRDKLPAGCLIQLQAVTAAPAEPANNMLTMLAKYMTEIRAQLADRQSMIDAQLGAGFFDRLATPEGPRLLLDKLEEVASFEGFLSDTVQTSVRKVMLEVYQGAVDGALKRMSIKPQERDLLGKVLNNKIGHPIKKTVDFKAFTRSYAGELQALSRLLDNIQKVQSAWPADFTKVLGVFDNSPHLETYPLALLARISGALLDNFDKNQPVPQGVLRQFLAFDLHEPQHQDAIESILEAVFDKDYPERFQDEEKQRLCELAIGFARANANASEVVDFLQKLMALQKTEPTIFLPILKLMAGQEHVNRPVFDSIVKVLANLDLSLRAKVLDFFTQDSQRAVDFLPVLRELDSISTANEKKRVLNIALHAARLEPEDGYEKARLSRVIAKLAGLPKALLAGLDRLYASPRCPDLNALEGLLNEENSFDDAKLQALERQYDRDYWSKPPHDQQRDFDTSKLASYVDNLRNLYYERPFLLRERNQLQRWFLYINAIGKDKEIPTRPGQSDGAPYKPVQAMSYDDMQNLLAYYRMRLTDKTLPEEQSIKLRLEVIALLREAMYRGTGKFPRPTQILYLLTAMQSGHDFIAQIPTGQGKSLTGGLAAAFANLEGKTVDICTSNQPLAAEALAENEKFFAYLGLSASLIHANSAVDAYQEGHIHYSCMPELALYRSRMELQGKRFSADATLIADEVDFSTLDDSTRYRFATALDAVSDPYKSPYAWIYESLVQFVDAQNTPKTDAEFLASAKAWLRNAARSKLEKGQLKALEDQPDMYHDRLETWLTAAGKTRQLLDFEEVKFRIVSLEHPKYGSVSKACILSGGRPNIQAEFSNGIQQFLHVRLRQKYREQIDARQMPDFLVEPEKSYVSSSNSKILLNSYNQRLGMSGTVGSRAEIREQYAKYGFRFADIPPFVESLRQDLKPILTNPKLLADDKAEQENHLKCIVRETLCYVSQASDGAAGPILIHCADSVQGEAIFAALEKALQGKKHIPELQRFYSSEKPTPEARIAEEKRVKEKAGQRGVITISSVFGRGTDIKPSHVDGLYTIDTFVDTAPYSSEDLERSKRQKIGRSGRAGQAGHTRLIVRRSEFRDIYSPKTLREMRNTPASLDKAIAELNQFRNQRRVLERASRESFDDIKKVFDTAFSRFIEVVNHSESKASKKAIRDNLLKHWSLFLSRVDKQWDVLQHDDKIQRDLQQQLSSITVFACREWNTLAGSDGPLAQALANWANRYHIELSLPMLAALRPETILQSIEIKQETLPHAQVKRAQLARTVDSTVSEAAVFVDVMRQVKHPDSAGIQRAITEATKGYFDHWVTFLSTDAHRQKLQHKFAIAEGDYSGKTVENIMGALLYLRYGAFRDGNPLGYAQLSQQVRQFAGQMLWTQNNELSKAVHRAVQQHFTILSQHRGEYEQQKKQYVAVMMSELRALFPAETAVWKSRNFSTWWTGGDDPSRGIKAQALQELRDYKDKWWTRSWVSGDRKAVVTTLLSALDNASEPLTIMEAISKAREQLLKEDSRNKRVLKSTLQGRLYRQLDALEYKVQAAMTPEQLDANTPNVLKNVERTLERTLTSFIEFQAVRKMLDVLKRADDTDEGLAKKYQKLNTFLSNVAQMRKPKGADDENWQVFKTYCQETRWQLLEYFAQSDKNQAFIKNRSIEVYQAASFAAATFFRRLEAWEEKTNLQIPDNKFSYRDGELRFIFANTALSNDGLGGSSLTYRRVNRAEVYQALLANVEQAIIEHSPDGVHLQFQSLTLASSAHYEDNGFCLTIAMMLDDVPVQLHYHFQYQTGELYCDDSGLKYLDMEKRKAFEPDTMGFSERIKTLGSEVEELKNQGELLMDSTQAEVFKPPKYS